MSLKISNRCFYLPTTITFRSFHLCTSIRVGIYNTFFIIPFSLVLLCISILNKAFLQSSPYNYLYISNLEKLFSQYLSKQSKLKSINFVVLFATFIYKLLTSKICKKDKISYFLHLVYTYSVNITAHACPLLDYATTLWRIESSTRGKYLSVFVAINRDIFIILL